MYKTIKQKFNGINRNKSYVGESIEKKVYRITTTKEPIKDGAESIYTERSEGVKPEYDIRTDRFEIAINAMDKVSKTVRAKRDNKPTIGEEAVKGMEAESGKASPIGGTGNEAAG